MSDQENKNKSLTEQLGKIHTQLQKWQKELEGYKNWALENVGIITSDKEREIDRLQKEINDILLRVAQIAKTKGILAFMDVLTKEKTKANDEIKEDAPITTEIESTAIKETSLERPDPLKAVAALENEEAMAMLEDIPTSIGDTINGTNFSYEIKSQLAIIFKGAEENQLNIDKLNGFISAINLYFADKRIEAFYKASQEKAVVEVLKTVNLEHDYTNLEVAFLKYLKEHGTTPDTDNVLGDTKTKITLTSNLNDWISKAIGIPKKIKFLNTPCFIGLDNITVFFEFAFEKNEFTGQLHDYVLWEMFKKTNNIDVVGKRFASAITAATLKSSRIDFGWVEFELKFDFAQFSTTITKAKDLFNKGILDIQPLSLTLELIIPTREHIANIFFGESKLADYILLGECNIKGSLKFAVTIDVKTYMLDQVTDAADKELLKKIDDYGEKAIKSVEELGKDAKKASTVFRSHIEKLEDLSKGLKSKPGIIAGKGLIKGVGTKVIKSLAARILLKAIPIVNVISTIYDVFWIGVAVYNHFNAPPGISEEDAKKMCEAKEKEFRLQQVRTKQSENPRKKKFVVLLVYEGIPNNDNGMHTGRFNKSDWKRYNIYLKFYEDSDTAGQYFLNPSSYEGKMLETGSEVVGDGIKIAYDFKEVPIQDPEKSLSYNACKILNLEGDDKGALYLIHNYNDIQRRLKINKNY